MADNDWESVTRIGSKVRGPGSGGVDRERVVKGKAAINAAQRSGAIVGTEKKFVSSNSKTSAEGQHLTKVDRSDEIIKPKTVGLEVGRAISRARNEKDPTMTQKQLADKIKVPVGTIQAYENGSAPPNQKQLADMERILGVKLRGTSDIGTPLPPKGAKK